MRRLSSRALARLLVVGSLLAIGCAQGGTGASDTGGGGRDVGPAPDGGGRDGGGTMNDAGGGGTSDAGRFDAGRLDAGRSGDAGGGHDAGSVSCPSGQHACGAGCVRDLANDPANGCRLGCGEPCPTPAMGTASCDMTGHCAWDCTPPYRRVGDTCECTPTTCEAIHYECGAPDNGCGMPLDCGACMDGAMCTTGRCACTPDTYETNDSNTTASPQGGLNDADDPPDVILSANIDEMRDEDWWSFPITDGTDGGNPRITVTLADIPIGSDYALSAYYVCGDRTDNSTCAIGSTDNYLGHGCAGSAAGSAPETVELETDCDRGILNSDDSGTLYVRVTAPTWMSTCGPYRVTVRVR
ncbi:MAG: hypothetical protein K1X94_02680 [Sandaracinaceae bacterium]|nr:hypothetical protein [Sandaracinaceae bacterium]